MLGALKDADADVRWHAALAIAALALDLLGVHGEVSDLFLSTLKDGDAIHSLLWGLSHADECHRYFAMRAINNWAVGSLSVD